MGIRNRKIALIFGIFFILVSAVFFAYNLLSFFNRKSSLEKAQAKIVLLSFYKWQYNYFQKNGRYSSDMEYFKKNFDVDKDVFIGFQDGNPNLKVICADCVFSSSGYKVLYYNMRDKKPSFFVISSDANDAGIVKEIR